MKKIIKKWTAKELELINDEYPINPKVHSLFPDRLYQSVAFKAWELGLKAAGRGFIGVNPRYFDILNRNSAYTLGFVAADGNVFSNVLTITQKDRTILDLIADDMKVDEPYPIRKLKSGVHNFVIRNSYIVNALKDRGIYERKSLILGKVKVPTFLMRDFVRGYVDGDGSVGMYVDKRRGSYQLEVRILGTYNFLHWMQARAHMITNMPKRKVHNTHSKAKSIKYNGRNAALFLSWMYQDDPYLYLTRKREVFRKYLEIYPDRGTYSYNMPCPGSREILLGEDIVHTAR